MSDTRKGAKQCGYDYNSKRLPGYPSSGKDTKKLTHRLERIESKVIIRKELAEIDTRDFSYQERLITDAFDNLIKHKRSLLAACPGAGKTNMAIEIVKQFVKKYPKKKVLILTHGQTILRKQFTERLQFLGGEDFEEVVQRKVIGQSRVLVALPQTIVKREHVQCDLVVIDEAHHYYGAEMVTEIIQKTGAEFELLLTGTPSKFIDEMPIAYITLGELIERGVLINPSVMLERANLGDIKYQDYDCDREISPNKILAGASVESIKQVLAKNDPQVFRKTMIMCRGQVQAQEIYDYLVKQKYATYISTANISRNSEKTFNAFKDNGQFLIVVNRGVLGFDCDKLSAVIDLSLTLNMNKLFQQICRVVRKDGYNDKKYFKIYPDLIEQETKYVLLGVMSMAYEEGYLRSNTQQKSICPPTEFLEENDIFGENDDQISFLSFKHSLETTDILKFVTRFYVGLTFHKAMYYMSQHTSYYDFKAKHYPSYKLMLKYDKKAMHNHFADYPKPNRVWDLESAKAEAMKFTSRSEFQTKMNGALKYLRARDRKWLDDLFGNKMTGSLVRKPLEDLIPMVKKYTKRIDMKRHDNQLYEVMINYHRDTLDKLIPPRTTNEHSVEHNRKCDIPSFRTRKGEK